MKDLRRVADERDLLLIFDEVQTGMGRTGKLFAYEWSGVKPDIMALAKGLGGGFPIGACLVTARVGRAMAPGTHGSTFGGNPLACAVGNGVLDILLEDGFFERAQEVSDRLRAEMERLAAAFPTFILEIRGMGLMLGFRLSEDLVNGEVVNRLLEHNLLTVPAGDNVVRLLPPLIIGEQEVSEAIETLEEVFQALDDEQAEDAGAERKSAS